MGVWGPNVDQNDTFCEIVEKFKSEYERKLPVDQILGKIYSDFADDIWETDIIQLAIAECLWHIEYLDSDTLHAVEAIVLTFPAGIPLDELGADANFISQRKKSLLQFYAKIKKSPPRNQIWKPKSAVADIHKGDCFWYKAGSIYGALVLEAQEDYYLILLTEEIQEKAPDLNSILRSQIYTIAWFHQEELLPMRRMHSVSSLSVQASYYNQFGLTIFPGGSIQCTNVGQSATWKHHFRAISFGKKTAQEMKF